MKICLAALLLAASVTQALAGPCAASADWSSARVFKPRTDRFKVVRLTGASARKAIDSFNHTSQGCSGPADSAYAMYSPYEDGRIVFTCGQYVSQVYPVDRALLKDVIADRASLLTPSYHYASCPPREKPRDNPEFSCTKVDGVDHCAYHAPTSITP